MALAVYTLAVRSHRLQLAAVHGPPGTGKTFLMLVLFTLHLCTNTDSPLYWISGGNQTAGTTAEDLGYMVPNDSPLRILAARPTAPSTPAEKLTPSPLDAASIASCAGKRFLILTTGVLRNSAHNARHHEQRADDLVFDEAQQANLARDLISSRASKRWASSL